MNLFRCCFDSFADTFGATISRLPYDYTAIKGKWKTRIFVAQPDWVILRLTYMREDFSPDKNSKVVRLFNSQTENSVILLHR